MKPTVSFLSFLTVAASSQLQAAVATWDGSFSTNWNADNTVDSNWTGGAGPLGKPVATDSLVFDGSANTTNNNDFAALTTFNGISFAATANSFTLGGNSITLGGAIVNSSANAQTINTALTYAAVRVVDTAAGNVSLGGVLSGGTASGIQKIGASTLNLTGSGTIGNGGAGGVFPLDLRQGNVNINSGGTYTVTGEAAIGSIAANGGAGANVSLTVDAGSLSVSSWLSVARGNGVGAVSSDVVLNNAGTVSTLYFGSGYNGGNAANLPKGAITLNGTSSLTVTNNNQTANNGFRIAESAGSVVTMTLNGSSTLTANGGAATGTNAIESIGYGGKGVLEITSNTATANLNRVTIGGGATAVSNGVGALWNKGNLNITSVANVNNFAVSNGTNSYGYFRNDNGTASASSTVNLREVGFGGVIGTGSTSVVDVTSGTVAIGGWFSMNRNQGANISGDSEVNLYGGTLNLADHATQNRVNWSAGTGSQTSVINVANGGILGSLGPLTELSLQNANSAASAGILTIATGGTVQITSINAELNGADTTPTVDGKSIVNFNGGTLKANAATARLLATTLSSVNIHAGGAIIDTNNFDVTIPEPLLAPAADGVTTFGVTSIPVTANGAGYIGRPLVKISGGGGSGATASANLDPVTRQITGVTITSPGSGYTSAPTVTLVGGGATTAATLGTVGIGAAASGGLTKTGNGSLTLSGADTFTGPIAANGGVLNLGGTYNNAVNVGTGGTLVVKSPLGSPSTLNVSSLAISAGSRVDLDVSNFAGTNDTIAASGNVTLGTAAIYLYDDGTANTVTTPGVYTLFTYGGSVSGAATNLTVGNPVSGYNYVFSASGGQVKVTISFTDTDGDQMPNIWETQNGLNPNNPNDATGTITYPPTVTAFNSDGDFMTNLEEFQAGTNPNSATSDGFNTDNDLLLDSWEVTNFLNIAARDGLGDYDGDLATDAAEFYADSNPKASSTVSIGDWPDSDLDDMNDAWEVKYFTTITAKNGSADSDGDGASDLEEFQALSNPNDAAWTPTKSQIIHRWGFNGTLDDSITGVSGITNSPATIVDPNGATASSAVTLGAGDVLLAGGANATSDYVSLGSNLLGGRATSATVELWATQVAVQNWSRIFDFGSGETENLFMSWSAGVSAVNTRQEWKDYVTTTSNTAHAYALGKEYHILAVFEPGAGSLGLNKVSFYSAPQVGADLGAAFATLETANNLTNLTDTLNAIGHSPYPGDNVANARYNDVRIWNGALTETERERLHDVGADSINITDSEPDGLVDAWEIANFGSIAATTGGVDSDSDGFTNAQEQAGRSNPNLNTSYPDHTDGDTLSDAWEVTNFVSLDQLPTGDPDGDGANNEAEETAGTNPNNAASWPDTDGDGLKDAWEVQYFGDLDIDNDTVNGNDGTADFDGDGASDGAEFAAGTNPIVGSSKPPVIVDLPAVGTDGASDISSTKTYTHAIDFGATVTPVTLNGVAFHQASVPAAGNDGTNNDRWDSTDNTGGRSGPFTMMKSVADDWPQAVSGQAAGADGEMFNLLTDFSHINGSVVGSTQTITLGGLVPGTRYSTRFYYRPWALAGNRSTTLTLNGDGSNVVYTMNQDASPTASAHYVKFDFTANDSDLTVVFTVNSAGNTWHQFALTNEVVPAGDADLDKLPDSWEIANFGNTTSQSGTSDADSDGTDNRTEYLLGLSPVSGSQRFAATQSGVAPGTGVTLTWPAQNGLTFTVSRSTTMGTGSWTQLPGTVTATGATASYTDNTAPTGKAFYKVTLTTP